MNLPKLQDAKITGKTVLLRTDYDVPLKEKEGGVAWEVVDGTRIESSLPTIKFLLSKKAKITILTHLGRPKGKKVLSLSLKPVASFLASLLYHNEVKEQEGGWSIGEGIFLRENLRFERGEEENSEEFARRLASLGDFYANEAFACSHRRHASIVRLPSFLPHAAGFNLSKEVETLSRILEHPKRPLILILGGVKEDKLVTIKSLIARFDYVLLGGRLPLIIEENASRYQFLKSCGKVVLGKLTPEKNDISPKTIQEFKEIIKEAGTIVLNGPMGKYEGEEESGGWETGTREIGRAVAESRAFTVVGGGDTEAALTKFGLIFKMGYISSGGGAMLEFLANGDLPGLKALRE